ncbi:glycoside hydrolase [Rhizobium leguminosarum]|uniref:glycoside hydrolase family 25 protein n=1 Tax=Rhizobium leguminosarum TaxID=384 RepID=UPI001C96A027|nr:glycoside hydrolase family 25 protein [Rhizobium leguminosarum]MBY5819515.1 glycoside hydrolase [Rhizobium leguminosarum]
MLRALHFATSAALFLSTQFIAVHTASAQPYECQFDDAQPDGSFIELDAKTGLYKHTPLSPPEGEEAHVEGSLASEAKFVENEGAIAAVIHILGVQQGGQIIGGDTHLLTFHMSADGKFVEVFDGKVNQGTCKEQVPETEEAGVSQETAVLAGDPFSHPWDNSDTAIVLDPFRGNSIDWDKVKTDPRVVGMIHKASQGLGADNKYAERKNAAVQLGYAWGSYHLLTTADATQQIDHYLSVVGNDAKESRAVDVECLAGASSCQSASFKVSVASIETALRRVKEKAGHFPLLYVNHSVATALSTRWKNSVEFANVRLWYARFKNNVTDFPVGPWQSYALWQFSSEINCTPSSCPYRVPGTQRDMDLNLYFGTPEQLKSRWPLER